ncbi:hypothetical protein BH10PSE18_BH10PSE18_27780 [soil metagenome]
MYHENGGSVFYPKNGKAFKILKILSLECPSSTDSIKKIVGPGWCSSVLDLWVNDILRIRCLYPIASDAEPGSHSSRYKWMKEYLGRYSGRNVDSGRMLLNLQRARVCIIGVGGLGSTLAVALAASGIGKIRLVDGDDVEESNLTRQLFYKQSDIGHKKTRALRKVIEENNSETTVETVESFVDGYEIASEVIENCDFVVLCADQPRFKIKGWIGKTCLERNVPHLLMAGKWVGPIMHPYISPCYLCLGRNHASKISDVRGLVEATVTADITLRASFGPRPLIVAGLMSSAIIHYLSGIDRETFLNKRYSIGLFGSLEVEEIHRYRDCPACGERTQS